MTLSYNQIDRVRSLERISALLGFLTLGIFWNGQQTQLNHFGRAKRRLAWHRRAGALCGGGFALPHQHVLEHRLHRGRAAQLRGRAADSDSVAGLGCAPGDGDPISRERFERPHSNPEITVRAWYG